MFAAIETTVPASRYLLVSLALIAHRQTGKASILLLAAAELPGDTTIPTPVTHPTRCPFYPSCPYIKLPPTPMAIDIRKGTLYHSSCREHPEQPKDIRFQLLDLPYDLSSF